MTPPTSLRSQATNVGRDCFFFFFCYFWLFLYLKQKLGLVYSARFSSETPSGHKHDATHEMLHHAAPTVLMMLLLALAACCLLAAAAAACAAAAARFCLLLLLMLLLAAASAASPLLQCCCFCNAATTATAAAHHPSALSPCLHPAAAAGKAPRHAPTIPFLSPQKMPAPPASRTHARASVDSNHVRQLSRQRWARCIHAKVRRAAAAAAAAKGCSHAASATTIRRCAIGSAPAAPCHPHDLIRQRQTAGSSTGTRPLQHSRALVNVKL